MADDDYAERLARGEPRAVLHAYGHPGAYERVTAERDAARDQLAGLLAIIHRDGGQHQAQHGTQQAVLDAVEVVLAERGEARDGASWPQGGRWTREPAEVGGLYVVHGWAGLRLQTLRSGVHSLDDEDHRWSTPLPPMPPVPEES